MRWRAGAGTEMVVDDYTVAVTRKRARARAPGSAQTMVANVPGGCCARRNSRDLLRPGLLRFHWAHRVGLTPGQPDVVSSHSARTFSAIVSGSVRPVTSPLACA